MDMLGGSIAAGPWDQTLDWAVPAATILVVGFYSLRDIIMFRRTVKKNRAAGLYDDPEFKRRIRPLNILRYGLVGVELLSVGPALWALQAGMPAETVAVVWFAVLVPVAIWSIVVGYRWRRLMTRGLEKDDRSQTQG